MSHRTKILLLGIGFLLLLTGVAIPPERLVDALLPAEGAAYRDKLVAGMWCLKIGLVLNGLLAAGFRWLKQWLWDVQEEDIIYTADSTIPAPVERHELIALFLITVAALCFRLIGSHGEFVHGSRLVYPMDKEAMRFLNILGNKFFSYAFSYLLEQRFKDTLCGTKVLYKTDYELIAANRHYFGDFDPFGDFDLIFGAAKLNLKIVEIPIHYHERTYGTTNISRFKHGWLLVRMCFFAMRKIKFV